MRRAAALLALLALAVPSGARASGPFETFGVDARAKGMANAQTAFGGGFAASHYNPAALSRLERPELFLEYSLSLPGVEIETEKEPAEAHLKPRSPPSYGGALVGVGLPLTGFLDDRLFLGLSLYLPTFSLTHAAAPDPATPFLYLYDTYTDHYEIEPAVSLKWFDWLSTGVGLRIGAGQKGFIDLALDPLERRVTRQSITAEQYPIHAPTAGVTLGPFGWDFSSLALGFSYRERLTTPIAILSQVEVDGLDVDVYLPVVASANFSPRTFNAGVAYVFQIPVEGDESVWSALSGSGHLAVDLSYAVWSEAPSPFLTVRSNFSGDGLDDLGLGGKIDAPGPGQSRIREVGLEDTFSVKAGVEYRFLDEQLALRGGYAYRPTPVPDQTSGTNIIDASAHIVAGGLGARFSVPFLDRPLLVDLAWQTQLLKPRVAEKQSEADPVGNWRVSGSVSEVSAGLGYEF